MKRVIVTIGLVLALAAPVLRAEADDRPDIQLKCRNGRFDAKVWLTPFKVENKCPNHSKQWVEIVFHDTDEDTWIINVAAGAKYKTGENTDPEFKVYARLGRGVFCGEDADVHYADTNHITTVYSKGSTWRAACDPNDERHTVVVSR